MKVRELKAALDKLDDNETVVAKIIYDDFGGVDTVDKTAEGVVYGVVTLKERKITMLKRFIEIEEDALADPKNTDTTWTKMNLENLKKDLKNALEGKETRFI